MNSPFALFALFSLTCTTYSSAKLICTFEDVSIDTIWCIMPTIGMNFLEENQEIHGLSENSRPSELIASNCRLYGVHGEFFKNLKTVQKLDLSNNLIDSLSADVFMHIPGLRLLNLANNLMDSVDPSTFRSLVNLRVLDISGNLFTDSNIASLNGLRRLSFLHTSHNKYIRKFPSLSNRISVRTLKIANTSLSLPPVFEVNMPYLLNLDLSHNSQLYSDNNAADTLRKCLRLVSFRMSHCELRSIDEKYFENTSNIALIDISHNELTELSANQFSSNPKLTHLDISNNNIRVLSMFVLSSNPKLASLKMAKNNLKSLPEQIFNSLVELEYLDLGQNEIQTIPTMLFSKTTKLSTLLMDENKIKTIHQDTFVKVIGLRSLILSGNSMTSFNYKIISPLGNLIELNIKNNHLKEISEDFFRNQNYLLILNLSCNMLVDLKPPVETNLSTKVIIQGNPLNCDCLNSLFRYQDLQFSLDWSLKGEHPSCVVGTSGFCDKNIDEVGLSNWKRELSYYPGLCRSRV